MPDEDQAGLVLQKVGEQEEEVEWSEGYWEAWEA